MWFHSRGRATRDLSPIKPLLPFTMVPRYARMSLINHTGDKVSGCFMKFIGGQRSERRLWRLRKADTTGCFTGVCLTDGFS